MRVREAAHDAPLLVQFALKQSIQRQIRTNTAIRKNKAEQFSDWAKFQAKQAPHPKAHTQNAQALRFTCKPKGLA